MLCGINASPRKEVLLEKKSIQTKPEHDREHEVWADPRDIFQTLKFHNEKCLMHWVNVS